MSPASAPPCLACLTIELTQPEAESLAGSREPLDGVQMLLSWDETAPERLPGIVERLTQRGATVAIRRQAEAPPVPDAVITKLDTMILDLEGPEVAGWAAERRAYEVKMIATRIRAAKPGVTIGLRPGRAGLELLTAPGLHAYVDLLVVEKPQRVEAARRLFPGAAVWVDQTAEQIGALERLLAAAQVEEADRVIVSLSSAAIRLLNRLREVVPAGLTPLDEVSISCDPGCTSRVFLHPQTLDAIAVVSADRPIGRLMVRPSPTRIDAYGDTGEPHMILTRRVDGAAALDLPTPAAIVVFRIAGWRSTAEEAFASSVQVKGARELSVDEIVARHQAARTRQRHAIKAAISSGTTVLTFEAPGFAAPITITAETAIYEQEGFTEVEERSIRINGLDLIGKPDGEPPRLPIIEPERISTPPLVISLVETYRYRLDGREVVRGRPCYVVSFEPANPWQPGFEGRAWIAVDDFGMVRVDARQTALRGPIVMSRQRDDFTPVRSGSSLLWLLWRSDINQMYQGAGHRTPIHRVVRIAGHEVNPRDFQERLRTAHASTSVMLRDTPDGFRYLRRTGAGAEAARIPVREAAERVRTIAFGVIVDPNINIPLLFAGLSYLDFNFLKTGTQLTALYAGSYGRAAWTTPRLGRTAWQVTGDAFGILAKYNDRSFRSGLERYDENLAQRPARLSAGVARPLVERAGTRLRAAYELDYVALSRTASTAAGFIVPDRLLVHGARLAIDLQQGAWTAEAWWNPATRQRWRPWGYDNDERTAEQARQFQRYGAAVGRSIVLSPRAVARLEGAWMGGHDLDRFSRYSFGTFDNRLRGYPAASIRYDHGAIARGVVTWNALSRVRLDGFLDLAVVRDPGFGPRSRGYPGVGAAVEVPAPLAILMAVEWGYGIKARNQAGGSGTHVVQITGYKIF